MQDFHQLCQAALMQLHAVDVIHKQQDSSLFEHTSMQEISAALKGEPVS